MSRRVLLLGALVACVAFASALPIADRVSQALVESGSEVELSGSRCATAGGECFDLREKTCAGSFRQGLCPGAATVQCCIGAEKPSVSACAAQGGACIDSNSNSCSSGFRSGLCPGAGNIRCCIGGSAQRPATPAPVTPAPRPSGAITFAKLAACYPQGEAPAVKARIGGAVNADWITNTCAIRMSHTLNCAGKMIPQMGSESIRGKSPERWNYIFRVKQLSPYVKKIFGAGQTFKAPTGRGVPVSALAGKKGIIYFDTTGEWNDATGHFDLWDGKQMVENSHANAETTERYFRISISVTLWEF